MPFFSRKIGSSGEGYQYKPLRDQSSDIRILVLNSKGLCKPGIINVSIYHAYLSTKPDYEILSSTWSAEEEQIPIFVGLRKRRLRVPKRIADALLDLQHQTDSRQLWIDAICIDQGNQTERSQHVASRLADIHRKAPRVTYWLGPGDDSIMMTFSILRHMSRMVVVNKTDKSIDPSQDAKDAGLEAWADTTSLLPLSDEQLRNILALLNRDWFDRDWSLQEIRLTGLKANLVCGKAFMKWVNFRKATTCLYLKISSYRDLETDQRGRLEYVMRLCDAPDT